MELMSWCFLLLLAHCSNVDGAVDRVYGNDSSADGDVEEPGFGLRILAVGGVPVNGKFIARTMGSELDLICVVNDTDKGGAKAEIMWYIPSPFNYSMNRILKERHGNRLHLTIANLQSHDSGNFSCEAQFPDGPNLLKSFQLNVRPSGCSDSFFRCSDSQCIPKVYKCDGVPDCLDATDELLVTCGARVNCSDDAVTGGGELLRCGKRCWPRQYCCYQGNCTSGRFINDDKPCCQQYKQFYNRLLLNDLTHGHRNLPYDRTYLETAIYTIIGCAVAFILIVSVMIVAFCRVHLRQSARLSSYTHLRARQDAAALQQALADADHLLLPPGYSPHMMVTYNINNGVQVMPYMSPPSYSEAVRAARGDDMGTCCVSHVAPRETGPPPPYVSLETLPQSPSVVNTAADSDQQTDCGV